MDRVPEAFLYDFSELFAQHLFKPGSRSRRMTSVSKQPDESARAAGLILDPLDQYPMEVLEEVLSILQTRQKQIND